MALAGKAKLILNPTAIGASSTLQFINITGKGVIKHLSFYSSSNLIKLELIIDGVSWGTAAASDLRYPLGYPYSSTSNGTAALSLFGGMIQSDGIQMILNIPFQTSLKINFVNTTTTSQNMQGAYTDYALEV
jgi:hypothetical protein